MKSQARYLLGAVILMMIALQAAREIADLALFQYGVVACLLVLVGLMATRVKGTSRVFLIASVLLTGLLIARDADWAATLWRALLGAGFFVAFFSALTTLRTAAGSSPSMTAAGTYLAVQPPGRRYLALTFGVQAFALLLNYGAIQLLGTLSLASAKAEPDDRIRRIRIRRMLLAIQRGFVASLPWSPVSFSIAISVSVIPGTSWAMLAVPGIVTSLIIALSGWAVDTVFKPAPVSGATPAKVDSPGRWTALLPLGFLLALMISLMVGIEAVAEIRVVGLVLIIVPLLSLSWTLLQLGGVRGFGARFGTYVAEELPSYQAEILLVASAGYIGAVGSVLVAPYMNPSTIDLTVLPTWALLIGLVWIMPILGQLGANPILSLSLVGPLLPPAESFGLHPSALAVALISGWAMAGITSPFTAVNLLVGRFGGIPAKEVGWVWNRAHFLLTIALLCIWALVYAALTT